MVVDDINNSADAPLHRAAREGCEESRLLISRRAMLGGVTAGLFSSAFMPRFAEAATNDARLLIVILRGGIDGLNTVVPIGEPRYYSLRGGIAIPAASTIKINSEWGFHPAMKNFAAMYKAGDAAVIHGTCPPLRTKSHFDMQDNLENGLGAFVAHNSTGWLNRLLTSLPAGTPIKLRGAVQVGEAPLILRGTGPVLGWSPTQYKSLEDPTLGIIRSLYKQRDAGMSKMLEHGLKAHRIASRDGGDTSGTSILRRSFAGAGRLLAAIDGPRIGLLSIDGFDVHSEQGAVTGEHAQMLAEFDSGLPDFKRNIGAAWAKTVIIIVSEFGRNAAANGDKGTDHGTGTTTLLAGGAVNGGRMFGDWPGLAPGALWDGVDVYPTTDTRRVFKGVLRDHLGVPTTLLNSTIFPGSAAMLPLANLIQGGAGASPIAGEPLPAPTHRDSSIRAYRQALYRR